MQDQDSVYQIVGIPMQLKKEFKIKCFLEDVTMNSVMLQAMKDYCKGPVKNV